MCGGAELMPRSWQLWHSRCRDALACGLIVPVLHVIFYCPRIPGNSGAAIRLSANTGSMLHLVDPLFDMDDAKLRRAGLDYHDLASTRVHGTWEECLAHIPGRIFAFTARAERLYTQVDWRDEVADRKSVV